MKNVKKHLLLRGLKVKDKVSGREGIIDFVSFDLYGCIQARINPGLDKDKNQADYEWMDVSRLSKKSNTPVLEIPIIEVEEVTEHFKMLGQKVESKVNGCKGIVDAISFDLYGGVFAGIDPGIGKDNKQINGQGGNVLGISILSKKPIMKVPDFEDGIQAEGKQGPADKRGRFIL